MAAQRYKAVNCNIILYYIVFLIWNYRIIKNTNVITVECGFQWKENS
jgi:hypothetical protein